MVRPQSLFEKAFGRFRIALSTQHNNVFLTRAHAQNLETERLSLAEAKAISQRLRAARSEITNQSILSEIRDRVQFIDELLSEPSQPSQPLSAGIAEASFPIEETKPESSKAPKPWPVIRVYDYEQLRQEHGL